MSARQSCELMIVDDDASDVELMSEAVRTWRQKPRIVTFENGEAALAYLESGAPASGCRLILLDLNMPGIGGRETLKRLKSKPAVRAIPVIVLTTSGSPEDIKRSYEDGANCYIIKPLELSQLFTIAKRLEDFWLETVALPD